ncbi:MAG: FAD-dependent oxidoreductase [Dehalococcoidales bacterium]|nr:FAD-dependent oxidoreductase [Dehalococcoidales bacterium]
MYDLIIIGGGPAGLCATIYAARKQLKTMLVTEDIGGQVNSTLNVENYLGYQVIEGPELISKFQAQAGQFPIDQKVGVKVSRLNRNDNNFEVTTETNERYQSRTVILATGKQPKKLNVPGEAELLGRGVSYCAICDGPVFAGEKVAVVGGGNSAVSAVLDLLKLAKHVYLISLTPLTADPVLVNQMAGAKNLDSFIEYKTVRIEGETRVESIVIKDIKRGDEKRLEAGGVFVEIGLEPNSDLVKGLVPLNRVGEIPVSCFAETIVPGLFAAGDVTDVPEKQIIIAAGEGAKAALQAHRYLQRQGE